MRPGHFGLRCAYVLNGQGFTLMELLLVLLVAGILTGLLLPVLVKAKRKAQNVQCLANMKQWNLGVWLYTEDDGDRFPYEGHFLTPLDRGNNLQAWYNVLPAYTDGVALKDLYEAGHAPLPGSRSLFACPSVSAVDAPTNPPNVSNPFFMYGFNNRLDPNGPGRFRRFQLRKPSQTVTMTENSQGRHPSTGGRHTPVRHQGRANLAFADGHVEGVAPEHFRRTVEEDGDSRLEWAGGYEVYWYPFPGAPP